MYNLAFCIFANLQIAFFSYNLTEIHVTKSGLSIKIICMTRTHFLLLLHIRLSHNLPTFFPKTKSIHRELRRDLPRNMACNSIFRTQYTSIWFFSHIIFYECNFFWYYYLDLQLFEGHNSFTNFYFCECFFLFY